MFPGALHQEEENTILPRRQGSVVYKSLAVEMGQTSIQIKKINRAQPNRLVYSKINIRNNEAF